MIYARNQTHLHTQSLFGLGFSIQYVNSRFNPLDLFLHTTVRSSQRQRKASVVYSLLSNCELILFFLFGSNNFLVSRVALVVFAVAAEWMTMTHVLRKLAGRRRWEDRHADNQLPRHVRPTLRIP